MSVEVLEISEVEKLAPITKVESEIIRMRNEYSGLTIAGVDDKAGFNKVSAARKEVKAVRVQVEKERKALVDDAVKWQRQVNEAANGIKDQLVAIEEPLQKLEDDFLAEKERIKQEVERLRREKIQNRVQVIMSVPGVNYNGVLYTLSKFNIGQLDVENLSDDDFQSKVEALEAEYQIILEERLAAEQAAKEEADRLEAQRREQEAAAAELKRQQEELEAEKRRIAEEQERKEAEIKAQHEAAEVELRRQREELEAKEREQKHQEELEAARKEAAEKARIEAELKAQRDAEAKAEADRLAKEKEARKLARRPDQLKFADMTSDVLKVINSFEFKTEEGKTAQASFLEGVKQLIKTSTLSKAE